MEKGNLTSISDMEAIAVTIGPGQLPSLNEGIQFAQNLASEYNLPLIPVSHLESHILSARLDGAGKGKDLLKSDCSFPFLGILTTGGHTEFILSRGVGLHTILGFSMDLSIGTYLDRIASHL